MSPRPAPSSLPIPTIEPNPNGLPGQAAFADIVGGLLWYGLLGALATIAISCLVLGLGRYFANHHAVSSGRLGLFGGLAMAIVIGGARQLVSWAYSIGAGF
ncbi:DUF6112 family protein [Sphaerisporangium album]|nr:DUF6112 family protein [Sphaerisporangium album]